MPSRRQPFAKRVEDTSPRPQIVALSLAEALDLLWRFALDEPDSTRVRDAARITCEAAMQIALNLAPGFDCDDDQAKSVAGEAMLRLTTHLKRRGPRLSAGWIFTVCLNLFRNLTRNDARLVHDPVAVDAAPSEYSELPAAWLESKPGEDFDRHEILELLPENIDLRRAADVVQLLSRRDAFILKEKLAGSPSKDIAMTLAVQVGVVDTAFHRTIAALRLCSLDASRAKTAKHDD